MTSEPIRDPRADHLLTPQNCAPATALCSGSARALLLPGRRAAAERRAHASAARGISAGGPGLACAPPGRAALRSGLAIVVPPFVGAGPRVCGVEGACQAGSGAWQAPCGCMPVR
jgi:hypothetical protein